MIRSLPIVLVALLGTTSWAQTLVVLPTEDPDLPHFNERFIARNGIKSITGTRLLKRDNEPMREQRERYLYRFDEQGRLIYSNNSYGQPGTGKDTASTVFTLDPQGRVSKRLRNDLSGHFAYVVERDDAGRPVRETYQRIENLGTDRYELIPGTITEISDEHFRYATVNDTVLRKLYVNYLDLPFREQTFVSDRKGYLLEIEDRYLVSARRSRIRFTYDDNGRLATRREQPDLAQTRFSEYRWRYDAAGNVIEAERWNDGEQVYREEFLYEDQTMLLKARLRKDLASGNIHVVKYSTQR